MPRLITILLAGAVSSLALALPTAQSNAQNSIVFILDASGSMAAKSGAGTKMEAAKRVLTELIGDLPQDTRAGLMAYGHRQKNNCGDVELLLSVEPVAREAFARTIKALQPLGQTPISDSIRQAAGVLKGTPGKKAVILISDGEETCKQDPCAVAANLKKADVDLRVHVVGFGLDTPAAKKQLRCVATSTGGTYAEAGNAAELKAKIKEAATVSPPARAGKLASVIQDMDGGTLRYGVSFYKPVGKATDQPVDFSAALGPQALDSVHEVSVPPGTYDVLYSAMASPAVWKRAVEIRAGETTRVEIPRFGRIRLNIKDQNGQPVQMWVEVKDATPQQNDLISDHRYRETIDVPAGTYDLKFWNTGLPETWRKGVAVKSAQETRLDVTVRR